MTIKERVRGWILTRLRHWLPLVLPDIQPARPDDRYILQKGFHDGFYTNAHVIIDEPSKVHIGEGSFLNHYCILTAGIGDAEITIGKDVFVAYNCVITTVSHEIGSSEKRAGENIYKSVNIGDGVWIGASSTILPGVTIGKGAVIAAGSVVTKDCEPDCLYAGVPAKLVKKL